MPGKNEKPAPKVPLSLAIAGLLFGVGLRAGQAYALDGGELRCEMDVLGEFVEARRVEGVGPVEPDPGWRARAPLVINGQPDTTAYLYVFEYSASDEDYVIPLKPESAP